MEEQLIGLFLCSLNEPGLRQQQCYEALLPHCAGHMLLSHFPQAAGRG